MKSLKDYLQEASQYFSFQASLGKIPFSKAEAEALYMRGIVFAPYDIQEEARKIIHAWVYGEINV